MAGLPSGYKPQSGSPSPSAFFGPNFTVDSFLVNPFEVGENFSESGVATISAVDTDTTGAMQVPARCTLVVNYITARIDRMQSSRVYTLQIHRMRRGATDIVAYRTFEPGLVAGVGRQSVEVIQPRIVLANPTGQPQDGIRVTGRLVGGIGGNSEEVGVRVTGLLLRGLPFPEALPVI